MAAVGVAHAWRTIVGDIILGCVIAFWLRDLAAFRPIGGLYAGAAQGLSEISYTLYAVHFPLLLMLWFWLLAPDAEPAGSRRARANGRCSWPSRSLYATAVWFLFERRTDAVRGWMRQRLGGFRLVALGTAAIKAIRRQSLARNAIF